MTLYTLAIIMSLTNETTHSDTPMDTEQLDYSIPSLSGLTLSEGERPNFPDSSIDKIVKDENDIRLGAYYS